MEPVVLIIDDEPVVLQVARDILQLARYSVLSADSAMAAIDLFKNAQRLDILLVEASLPKISGFSLAAKIKQLLDNAHLGVVIMSGWNYSLLFEAGDITDSEIFLSKPFDDRRLLEAVRRALAPAGARPSK